MEPCHSYVFHSGSWLTWCRRCGRAPCSTSTVRTRTCARARRSWMPRQPGTRWAGGRAGQAAEAAREGHAVGWAGLRRAPCLAAARAQCTSIGHDPPLPPNKPLQACCCAHAMRCRAAPAPRLRRRHCLSWRSCTRAWLRARGAWRSGARAPCSCTATSRSAQVRCVAAQGRRCCCLLTAGCMAHASSHFCCQLRAASPLAPPALPDPRSARSAAH